MAIQGQRAFFGTFDNEVLAVDWHSDRILWRYDNPDKDFPFYSSAALAGDLVIVGGRDKLVHALDAATGELVWSFLTQGKIDASPVVVDDAVFVPSMDGTLYRLDTATGKETWRYELAEPMLASPAVAAGTLVLGTLDGTVFAFGARAAPSSGAER